jgi:hypothetical protein
MSDQIAEKKTIVQLGQLGRRSFRSNKEVLRVDDLIKHAKSPSQNQTTKYVSQLQCFPRGLRALVVRCFDGGGLGFFLGNTFGDENTEVGRTKFIMTKRLKEV